MQDGGKIFVGLGIALILLLFPLWYNIGKTSPAPDPKLTKLAESAKTCVRSTEFMRTEHMQVLEAWRNAVVRDGNRWEVMGPSGPDSQIEMQVLQEIRDRLNSAVLEVPGFGVVREWFPDGDAELLVTMPGDPKKYEMSLQNTCMKCHSNKEEFCDQCHNYANVSPFCWDCHVQPPVEQPKES